MRETDGFVAVVAQQPQVPCLCFQCGANQVHLGLLLCGANNMTGLCVIGLWSGGCSQLLVP